MMANIAQVTTPSKTAAMFRRIVCSNLWHPLPIDCSRGAWGKQPGSRVE